MIQLEHALFVMLNVENASYLLLIVQHVLLGHLDLQLPPVLAMIIITNQQEQFVQNAIINVETALDLLIIVLLVQIL